MNEKIKGNTIVKKNLLLLICFLNTLILMKDAFKMFVDIRIQYTRNDRIENDVLDGGEVLRN